MKRLILETSTEKGCALLTEGEQTLAYLPLGGGPHLSKAIASEVARLLEEHSFQPDEIAVGRGPGSSTGIRVGRALAQGLSLGWGVPLREFCSLIAFLPSREGRFAILVDARSAGIYALLGEKTTLYPPEKLLSPEEISSLSIDYFASPHPPLLQKRLPPASWEEVEPFHCPKALKLI